MTVRLIIRLVHVLRRRYVDGSRVHGHCYADEGVRAIVCELSVYVARLDYVWGLADFRLLS